MNEVKVLLVEDDEDDYVLTRSLLSEISEDRFRLDWVTDYDAALERLRQGAHDVCLLDYRLGAHTGLELLRAARQAGATIPIILLTGQGEREIDIEAMKAGAADYLIKGQLDASLLERSIRYSLEQKRIEEERVQHIREQEARAQAEAANKAKDEFLAMLSHELRSPLNAMLGWTQILESRDFDREITKQAMQVISRNVRLQNALIEDLLDVSRIISGKMRLESEMVSLVSIVQSALDAASPSAEKKSIRIESNLDEDLGEMFGDKHRLQQIVGNLLTNAIKFTPENGSISVTLESAADGQHAKLTVKDSGVGIAPELLPHIFDRFKQADTSSERQFGGLGLGLTIVKHLADLHGGTVAAHSDGAGAGATFTLELPLAAPTASRADQNFSGDADGDASAEKPLTGLRILVVDDDADALDLMGFVLKQKGAETVCAASAGEALERLQKMRFDLLISDLGMPENDGYYLIRQVRKNEVGSNQRLPAIALTGYVSADDRERVFAAGFQAHLPKPINIEYLSAVILTVSRIKSEHRPPVNIDEF